MKNAIGGIDPIVNYTILQKWSFKLNITKEHRSSFNLVLML